MKKIIISMLALSLMALCFSCNVNAQSSQQDLDKVELMKQYIGKWVTETGEDSTLNMEVIPFGKGFEIIRYRQAKGETYSTDKVICGFTQQYKIVNWYGLRQDGTLMIYTGKFVSDKKMILEQFDAEHKHVRAIQEVNFITPDKMKGIYKWRGNKETWDDAVVKSNTFTRFKK